MTRLKPDVMLLAAGYGKRMLPLTETTPKPLIEVAGQRLLDRVIANARDEDLDRFVINAHHLAPQIEAAAHERGLTVSNEPELLNTGGGVRQALPLLATDPILIMNTDAFWPEGSDAPIGRMIDLFAEKRPEMVLLCVQPRRAHGFRRSHDFCLAPDAHVTLDRGQPVIYGGVALVARSVFEGAPEGAFSLAALFDRSLERNHLYGVVLDAPWFHVGDVQGLAEADHLLASA
ncbi:Nucleotidyl transferase [Devosia sp. H5989]|nr:Nucleotidyl transferase [Devosia sp. H5989]